jgi:hypothetical protein
MIWTQVSPGIWTGEFLTYTVTKILLGENKLGKKLYTYIAVQGETKYKGSNWNYVKSRVLQVNQLSLFPEQ